MPDSYEVIGPRRSHTFNNLRDAVGRARMAVKNVSRSSDATALIWDNTIGVVIGLVTDDANGITVHKLKDWPEDVEGT